MEFICKIGTPTGEIEEQRHAAESEAALRTELERRGLYVFSVKRPFGLRFWRGRQKRISSGKLLVFCQEMSALLKAGLPVLQSLEIMYERQQDPVFKRSLSEVQDRVKSGVALSQAFADEGALYSPMLTASLVAGERSGSLDSVLRRFAHYMRLTTNLMRRTKSAAVYPAFVFGAMIVLGNVLLLFVIPRFEAFYRDLGGQLPLLTRILIWLGRTAQVNFPFIVIFLALAWFSGSVWLRREGMTRVLHRALVRLPLVGRLSLLYSTSQLARTLSTLLSGGLPLINALEVAAASMGNRAMAEAVAQTVPLIREGKSLSVALEATQMMDPLAMEMVRVGEQTGALSDMLSALADFNDEELEVRVNVLMSLVEPVMIVVMAVLVAVMLLAFYLPLFQAISAVQSA
jgi:type IV pilus assembly protein PilC